MSGRPHGLGTVALLAYLAVGARAQQVVPCAAGSGTDNGCGSCNHDLATNITPFSSATVVNNFDLPGAAAPNNGGGYNVWWNIPQPGDGCRTLITVPYTTDQGSVNSQLSGNVVVSTAHGGCFYGHVGSTYSVGFCCGDGDCTTAGAEPWAAPAQKRSRIPSRIERGLRPDRRQWRQPPPPPSDPADDSVVCTSPVAYGETYTKTGSQQVDGNTLNCDGGSNCHIQTSMAVSIAKALLSQQSSTITNSIGEKLEVEIDTGFLWTGTKIKASIDHSWSEAVRKTFGETDTTTQTATLAFTIDLIAGQNFNQWFAPTMSCQGFNVTCQGVPTPIEQCQNVIDGNGNPVGTTGVMAIG